MFGKLLRSSARLAQSLRIGVRVADPTIAAGWGVDAKESVVRDLLAPRADGRCDTLVKHKRTPRQSHATQTLLIKEQSERALPPSPRTFQTNS